MPLPPSRGAIVQPAAYMWFRGPAKFEKGSIVMDGRKAERYEPMADVGVIGVELARVKTPAHAVAFVERFGLLDGPGDADGEPCPPQVEQQYADFESVSEELRSIIRLVKDTRQAASGDSDRMDRLRTDFGPPREEQLSIVSTATSGRHRRTVAEWLAFETDDPMLRLHIQRLREQSLPKTDAQVLAKAGAWAALLLSNGLSTAHPYVFDAAQLFPNTGHSPGSIRLGILPEALRGFCFLSLAQQLERQNDGPLEWCSQCGRVFVQRDARKRVYCEPACGARKRWSNFKQSPKYSGRRGRKE